MLKVGQPTPESLLQMISIFIHQTSSVHGVWIAVQRKKMSGKIKWKQRGSRMGSFESQGGFTEKVIHELDHEGDRCSGT